MTERSAVMLLWLAVCSQGCHSQSATHREITSKSPNVSPAAAPAELPRPSNTGKTPVRGTTAEEASPSAPMPTTKAQSDNSVRALLRVARELERVSVVRDDTRALLGELTTTELTALREALLVAAPRDDMTLSASRWPVRVELVVRGKTEPFVATPHGERRFRLNPRVPGSTAFAHDDGTRDRSVQEIDVTEATFVALERVIGGQVELNKEHALDPQRAEELQRWLNPQP